MFLTKEKVIPVAKWREMALSGSIKPQDIIGNTVFAGGFGVEDFAQWLDANVYPGILQLLAVEYLKQIQSLLEEVLILDKETRTILNDPKKYFNVTSCEEAVEKTVSHFHTRVNSDSPDHVIKAMIAHIEYGLGDFIRSIQQAGFAWNDKHIENFAFLLEIKSDVALESMLEVEKHKAEILVVLIMGNYKHK